MSRALDKMQRYSGGGAVAKPGRPKRAALVAAEILRRTRNLESVMEFMLAVIEGRVCTPDGVDPDIVRIEKPTIKDRMAAAEWLTNRSIGKEAQVIEVHGEVNHTHSVGTVDIRRLSDEQLNTITGLLEAASDIEEAEIIGDAVAD